MLENKKNLKTIILTSTIIALSAITSGCFMPYGAPHHHTYYSDKGVYSPESNHDFYGIMWLGFPGHIGPVPTPARAPPPIYREPVSRRR